MYLLSTTLNIGIVLIKITKTEKKSSEMYSSGHPIFLKLGILESYILHINIKHELKP